MLQIDVQISPEGWDEKNRVFIDPKTVTLQLEHSLISISKWESKWHKPFISKKEKTPEEIIDYVKCMTLTQNVKPEVYEHITQENIEQVNAYIGDPMTATTFSKREGKGGSNEIVTSEILYYDMVAYNIPFECQKWHLNRLLTLIRVCGEKNNPGKKMSRNDILSRNAKLNEARRKMLHSKG